MRGHSRFNKDARAPEEWLRQADYDMDTAEYMFAGDRYFYAVFMCHLSIENSKASIEKRSVGSHPGFTI